MRCPRAHARSAARSRSTVPFSTLLFARCPTTTSLGADAPRRAGRLRDRRRCIPPDRRPAPAGEPARPARRATPPRRAPLASARTRGRPAAAASAGAVRCTAGACGRAGRRVAEVQERREQERHAAPPGQPQPARDRERVRERGRVDGVERAVVAARVAPHRRADRVARRVRHCQRAQRDERERLEDVAPAGEAQWARNGEPKTTPGSR